MYPLCSRFFFSHIGHHMPSNRVPCAVQQVLISYLFYTQQFVYVNTSLPIHPTPPIPPNNHKFIFYICNSISVLLISSFIAFLKIHCIGTLFKPVKGLLYSDFLTNRTYCGKIMFADSVYVDICSLYLLTLGKSFSLNCHQYSSASDQIRSDQSLSRV